MIIKKFQAKTENDAVEIAKKELGSGVVIMNVKNVKKKGFLGLFGGQVVEVTVAMEEESERQPQSVVARPVSPVAEQQTPPPMTALEQLAKAQRQEVSKRYIKIKSQIKKNKGFGFKELSVRCYGRYLWLAYIAPGRFIKRLKR